MDPLSNAQCLDLWERGVRLHPLDRGLLALGAALPGTPYAALADWPLGRRNRALLELCSVCFGPNLAGRIACTQCSEELEFQMDSRVLLKARPTVAPADEQESAALRIEARGHTYRLPTTRDLAIAAGITELRSAAIKLLEDCRIEPAERTAWLDEDLEEIGEKMASADPLAEIRLTFNCAKCGHEWSECLDLVAFLWFEIEARARRLLSEVHALAAAYGWAEKDILALSEARRWRYLEMVRA